MDNVQDGEDDCGEYYVSLEELEQLKAACEQTITYLDTLEKVYDKDDTTYYTFKNVDEEVIALQTTSGFFFGNIEYDSWTYEDTEYTLKVVNTILDKYNTMNADIYYQSSW